MIIYGICGLCVINYKILQKLIENMFCGFSKNKFGFTKNKFGEQNL